jgi:hypothetical protein
MRQAAFAVASMAVVLAHVLLAGSAPGYRSAAAQQAVSLAVDADPSGNTATSLGDTDQCASLATGDSFQVDIVVRDVEELLGWESYIIYDASILKLTDRDVRLFLAANAGSNVFDASDAPANANGRYRVAAADIADPPVPDSGSGVLARLTFDALAPGVSLISLRGLDISGDGRPDVGPILTAVGGQRIGDDNGDAYFDGPTADAWVAVDTVCPSEPPPQLTVAPFTPVPSTPIVIHIGSATPPTTPTPTSTPLAADGTSDGGDGPPWALIGGLSGGGVVLLAAALLLSRLRSRRAG